MSFIVKISKNKRRNILVNTLNMLMKLKNNLSCNDPRKYLKPGKKAMTKVGEGKKMCMSNGRY